MAASKKRVARKPVAPKASVLRDAGMCAYYSADIARTRVECAVRRHPVKSAVAAAGAAALATLAVLS